MTYSFDPTGAAVQNLVIGETASLIKNPNSQYLFVVFPFGPIYPDTFKIKHIAPNGAETVLHKNIDWECAFPYKQAMNRSNRFIAGGIKLVDVTKTGSIVVTGQVVGGQFSLNDVSAAAVQANVLSDPEYTIWEKACEVSQIPLADFPTVDYPYTVANSDNVRHLVDQLAEAGLVVQLRANLLSYPDDSKFIPTPSEIGLGNLRNFPISTEAQAKEGVSESAYMTPKTTAIAVEDRVVASLSAHGYSYPKTYGAGIQITDTKMTFIYKGSVYAAKDTAIPFRTDGSFESEKFTRIRTLERPIWKTWSYVITGSEARDAVGAVVIPSGLELHTSIKTRMTINSFIEPVRGVDFNMNGNVIHLRYPCGVGDEIKFYYKEASEDMPAVKDYYNAISIESGKNTYSLTDISGIVLDDLCVIHNDSTVLTFGVDYSFDSVTPTNAIIRITFPISLGDVIEIVDLDSIPAMGRFVSRDLLYVK